MPSRSLPSIPLIRKPRFAGSPSTRDVKPEHKYLVHAHRRLRAHQFASNLFRLKFTQERAEERDCREKTQEEVSDYRGSGQSPKRKAVESLCSLSHRTKPAPIFVNFDEAMDVDAAEDNIINPDFDMEDSSFDMDVDVETKDTVAPTPAFVPPPPPTSMSQLVQLMSALYVSTPPPPPPQHTTMSQLVQLMSALHVSTPSPPPYAPAPAPAPYFPPGLHVPAAEASEAATAEEAAPSAAAPVANGAASKGKAAQLRVPWNVLFQQLRTSRASEWGRGEQDDDEGWLV